MITFKSAYGNEIRTVELEKPLGSGGSYHIYENRHWLGFILLRNGKWVTAMQKTEDFIIDDLQILADIVEEHDPAVENI